MKVSMRHGGDLEYCVKDVQTGRQEADVAGQAVDLYPGDFQAHGREPNMIHKVGRLKWPAPGC